MRTKESEDFQEQENTWIYVLHQQAPPQTRETSVAALAQAAGAPPPLPPATALFGASSALFPSHENGPYAARPRRLDSGFPSASANGPYVFKTPRETGAYVSKQQQTAIGGANSSSRMMLFAHEKLQETWRGSEASSANAAVASAGASFRQPSAFAFPPPAALASEEVYRRKHHHYPAAELNGASAALEKYQQLDLSASSAPPPSSLLELLPKKRRRGDESKVSGESVAIAAVPAASEDAEAAELVSSASTPRAASAATPTRGKRNCFPKKCDFPMCKNSSRSRGFCYSHGGGRRCRVDGCSNGAVSRDLCKRHGGGRRCKVAGCKSSSESGGLCYSHGGGRRCSLAWCTARAKKGGFCALHLADQNADRPAVTPGKSSTSSSTPSTVSSSSGGDEDASPTHVVETLLALARDQQAPHEREAAATSGYAIASLLN